MHCPYCDKEHPDNADFCPTTGRSLRSFKNSINKCVNCGANISSGTKFCPDCGAPTRIYPGEGQGSIQVGERFNWSIVKWAGISVFIIIVVLAIFSFISGWLPIKKIEGFRTPFYPPSVTAIPTTILITTAPDYPQWLDQISNNPIIPSVGLAGVELGFTESEIIDVLGEPFAGVSRIEDVNGNVVNYALRYEYNGIFLGIFTTPDTRTASGIRLYDSDFNNDGYIPLLQGITIGSTETQLVRSFGQPLSSFEHFTCPDYLGYDRKTTTFTYSGIGFWVCEANKLVYLIDIP